ncbi:hypothetical protein C0046_02865, partial [Pseudomonas aeruginosa]
MPVAAAPAAIARGKPPQAARLAARIACRALPRDLHRFLLAAAFRGPPGQSRLPRLPGDDADPGAEPAADPPGPR